jgi:hypothetical protein
MVLAHSKLAFYRAIGLAKKQFELGDSLDQNIACLFYDEDTGWIYYLMNMDPKDTGYCWGLVDGFELEFGSFNINTISKYNLTFHEIPTITARDLYELLLGNESQEVSIDKLRVATDRILESIKVAVK